MHVIEAELIVGTEGNVGFIGLALGSIVHRAQHHADRQPQEIINLPHPLGVTLSQVVVHGNDVNTFAADCVEVGWQSRNQCLTFTGTHLGNLVVVQDHPADQLHVIMAHIERAHRGFSTNRESFVE